MIEKGYCSYVEAMQFDWDDYWTIYDMMEVSDWVDFELHYHAEQRARIK